MNISIDPFSGDVKVEERFTITSSLTSNQVTTEPIQGTPYNLSSLPYKWFSARTGNTQIEFCFFEGVIIHADFHQADSHTFEPSFLNDYRSQSESLPEVLLGVEQIRKHSNDNYLRELLDDSLAAQNCTVSVIDGNMIYGYRWGTASSVYKNGNAFLRIEYAGRRELAVTDSYIRKKHVQQLSRVKSFRERIVQE